MKKNIGSVDKIIRLLLVIVISVLFIQGTITGTIGIIALVLAIIFLLTSIVGFCPIYRILNLSTCKVKK
jgi:hypothetical protein